MNPAASLFREPIMSLQLYFAFVAACIALALLPGPIVTLVIGNGLRYGTRAALTNIAGAQAGLAIVIGIVAVGLTSLMATMGYWFDWVRLCRRRLSGLARHQADPLTGRSASMPMRRAAAAARRVLPARRRGAAVKPQGAGVLRRVHSAIHGHEPGSCLAGRPARRHLHGDRRNDGCDRMRCWPAGRACSSRRGGPGWCRASPAAA